MFLLPTSSLGWASAPDQCPGSAMLALGKYGVVSKLGLSIPTSRALPCSGTPRFQHGRSHPIFETHFRWVLFLREASLTSHSKEAPRPSPIFTLLYIFFFSSRHVPAIPPFVYLFFMVTLLNDTQKVFLPLFIHLLFIVCSLPQHERVGRVCPVLPNP